MNISVVLFDCFETLDVFGPVEVFGRLDGVSLNFISIDGKPVQSTQGVNVITSLFPDIPQDIVIIPGGKGVRSLVENKAFISKIADMISKSKWCLTVCTGSALVAKTGLLNGRTATSNKKAWEWVISMSDKVNWQKNARWCIDDKFYTSSGVSAGIDMSLGFISDLFGRSVAESAAQDIEYIWNEDKNNDPFCPKC